MSIENMGHYMMNIDESQGDIIIFFGLNSDLFFEMNIDSVVPLSGCGCQQRKGASA